MVNLHDAIVRRMRGADIGSFPSALRYLARGDSLQKRLRLALILLCLGVLYLSYGSVLFVVLDRFI